MGRRPDATRVVLDLAGPSRVSVFALYNPFRVVIDTERPAGAVVKVPMPSDPPVVLTSEVAVRPAAAAPVPTVGTVTPPRTVTALAPAAPESDPLPSAAAPVATATAPSPAVPAANTDGSFSLARQLGLGISRIVIDPGHGGHDPGTQAHGTSEADVVLDIALRLERLLLKEAGLAVVLTRRSDNFVPLEQRTAIANREGADLFLSIHANASRNTSARGVETYFLSFASSPDAEAVAARENSTSDRAMHNLPGIVRAIALNNKLDESRDLAVMVQDAMTTRLSRRQQRAAQPGREEGALRGADRRGDAQRAGRGGVPHQSSRGHPGEDAGLSPARRRGVARGDPALPPIAEAPERGRGALKRVRRVGRLQLPRRRS